MTERLSIKAFAGITSATIDVAQVTALIGPQASGKSVTAKLLFYFRGVWERLFFQPEGELDWEQSTNSLKEQFRRYFPPETWGAEVFILQYEIGDQKILLRRAPSRGRPSDGLILHLPSFSEELFNKFATYIQDAKGTSPSTFRSSRFGAWRRLQADLSNRLGRDYFSSQLFVPAGRAFFSNVENNVFSFISRSEKKLDPFLTEFGEYFTFVVKSSPRRHGAPSHREYRSNLSEKLLGGTLVLEKDTEFVKTRDGRTLPLSNLSSGQQEALPLLMTLDGPEEAFLFSNDENRGRFAWYIEEPEAHLFPDFQQQITERIIERARKDAQGVFLTTHSPYVLSTLNVLLLAGKIGMESANADRVRALVPESKWLPIGSVAAYSFGDGNCRSIFDGDSGLIDADYLDKISTFIAKTFDSLLAIEYPGSEVVSG